MADEIEEFQRKIEQIKRLIKSSLDPIADQRLTTMLEDLEQEVAEREARPA
jgi:TATA-binding protein-associated factor Taf7